VSLKPLGAGKRLKRYRRTRSAASYHDAGLTTLARLGMPALDVARKKPVPRFLDAPPLYSGSPWRAFERGTVPTSGGG